MGVVRRLEREIGYFTFELVAHAIISPSFLVGILAPIADDVREDLKLSCAEYIKRSRRGLDVFTPLPSATTISGRSSRFHGGAGSDTLHHRVSVRDRPYEYPGLHALVLAT